MLTDLYSRNRNWKTDLLCVLLAIYFCWSFAKTPRLPEPAKPQPPASPPLWQSQLKGADGRGDRRPVGDIRCEEIFGRRN